MTDRLYLVDGMSHIYRAYHAIQGLTNKQGLPTNAVYGFTNMLRKLIQDEKPEYLAVAIDVPGPTIRHQQYEQYKATRRPTPDDLIQQIPYVLKVCQVLGVPVFSLEGYEADDVIGTLTRKAEAQHLEVVIVTIDKDMFQLVNDRVTVLDTRNNIRLDPDKVEEKFGVPPDRVVDVLSLVGDTSDNIPGAPGIGEKGARTLIQEFGSLENLFACRDQVSRKSYRESLQKNEELIRQSQQLVTILEDLPLDLRLVELEVSDPDWESARDLFRELQFNKLLDELVPPPVVADVQCHVLKDLGEVASLGQRLKGKSAAMALYFPSGDYLQGGLEAIAVCGSGKEAWYLPGEVWHHQPEAMTELLAQPSQWVVHDLKPLYPLASRLDWALPDSLQDTMLMAYLVDPNQTDFSLSRLASEYLQLAVEQVGKGGGELFGERLGSILAENANATFGLFEALSPRIREAQLEALLGEIETPLVRVLASMEEYGVKLDVDVLRKMSESVEGDIEELTGKIYKIAGQEFNLNSPRQLADILFEKLNLPVSKKTRKAGHYATGVTVLEELAERYDIARLILDYRELSKLKNTYLDALPKLVNPHTGRIHTSYNQMVASTGRLSSSNPNLQNIPIKSELGRKIRRGFVAEPGYQILSADYSQIELRIMAHLSKDEVLLESFRKGEDVHERTAHEVFGMSAIMNPKEFRRHAKVINFGVIYGLSAFGLAKNLKIDRKEAQQFIDHYFEKHRGVKTWIDGAIAEASENGFVRTLFGRIRPIPEIHSKNRNLRSFAQRTAINAPIQGTAADLIKKAMVSVHQELRRSGLESRLVSQVHDELVVEVKAEEVEPVRELVREHMEQAAELDVPLRVDLGLGPSWFDAK